MVRKWRKTEIKGRRVHRKSRRQGKMIEKTRKYRGCRRVRFNETSPSER